MKSNWLSATWQYTDKNRPQVVAAICLSIVSIFLGIIPYYGVYKIFESLFTDILTLDIILFWGAISALGFIGKHVVFGFATTTAHKAAYNILENIRLRLTSKMTRLPLGNILNERIGKLKNLVIDQVETIELPLSHLIPEGVSYILLPLAIFTYLFMIDWRMALISLVTIPLAMVPLTLALQSLNKNYEPYMESSNYVNSVLIEYTEGLEVIKTFNQTGNSYSKFEKAVVEFKDYTLRWFKGSLGFLSMISAILPSSLIGTLPLGLYLCSTGAITTSEFILCILLALGIIEPLSKFSVFINYIKQVQYSVNVVEQFLALEELPNAEKRVALNQSLTISLHRLSFRYNEETPFVIKDVSMTIPQGKFVAFVGPSGSGKSTIAKLIARFWDPTTGTIELAGTNIKDIPLEQLAEHISFVTQDNFLFNDTLMENIRYGNPQATDSEVMAAAKAASCDEFIAKLERGYQTTVGEAGGRLSGGERQRIALARAILKDAPIIILDEATAFTDPENEAKIQQSLRHLTKNKTLIVIAHRLSTIQDADTIYVFNKGEIMQAGAHNELLQTSTLYQKMWSAHIEAQQIAVHNETKGGVSS